MYILAFWNILNPWGLFRRCAVTVHMGLVLASGLLIGFDGKEATKKEYARFEGTWSFALVEVEGVKRPTGPFATNKIIIGKQNKST